MINIGLFAAILTIFWKFGKSVTTKLAASKTDSYTTSFATRGVGLIFSIFLLMIFSNYFLLPSENIFWIAFILNSIILSITTICLTVGFNKSDISIISPLLAFVPLFSIFPAIIVLNQVPTFLSGIGIVLVTLGAYMINIEEKENGYLEPLKSLYYDDGARFAMYGVILSGMIPTFSKIGITYVSELMWLFLISTSSTSILGLILVIKIKLIDKESLNIRKSLNVSNMTIIFLFLVGLFNMLLALTQYFAYNYIDVAYVQAIKRLNILLAIIVGSLYFHEPKFKQRFTAGLVMICGVILIIFGM